ARRIGKVDREAAGGLAASGPDDEPAHLGPLPRHRFPVWAGRCGTACLADVGRGASGGRRTYLSGRPTAPLPTRSGHMSARQDIFGASGAGPIDKRAGPAYLM